ncbi:MAG: hypothetical protein H8K03_08820 [Nitrospira sp.]|jgi:hypothetical protein
MSIADHRDAMKSDARRFLNDRLCALSDELMERRPALLQLMNGIERYGESFMLTPSARVEEGKGEVVADGVIGHQARIMLSHSAHPRDAPGQVVLSVPTHGFL